MSIKISQLPAAATLANTAIFPIVQNATTEKATLAQLAAFLNVNPSTSSILVIPYTSSSIGSFVVPHGLGVVPSAVTFSMTNTDLLGQFWLDTSSVALGYDSTNVYGISSDNGISGQILIYYRAGSSIEVIPYIATVPGSFIVPHGLSSTPKGVTFTMTNTDLLGQFWLDTSSVALGYDSTNVYGISSDASISGQIVVFS